MSRVTYPSEQLDKFLVRMPNGLRDSLKLTAKQNRRSMNAEIVFQLERAIENEKAEARA